MYILLISSWFPSEQDPSFGSFVFEQAAILQSHGYRVEVLQPVLSGTAKETWAQKPLKSVTKNYMGTVVHHVPVNVRIPKIKGLYYRLLVSRSIRFLERHFTQNGKPDILHSHAAFLGGVVGRGIADRFRIPLVHTEHSSGFIFNPQQYDATDRRELQKLTRRARYLFVSHAAKILSEKSLGISFNNAEVLPNLVHRDFFSLSGTDKKEYDALCIGNFTAIKNQSFLLDVWKLVLEKQPSARLALAGSDFDCPGFLEKKKALGLDEQVLILPRLNRREVKEKIGQSRMVLSSSKVETFGLTLAESLARGVPVVATDSGGPRDIVSPGDGFLIAQNDAATFAQAILKIMSGEHDSPEQISERCRARLGEEIICTRLESIYRSLV